MADVFRCDYCGQWRPLRDARLYYIADYQNTDGDTVHTVAIGCSELCAESLASVRIGGR